MSKKNLLIIDLDKYCTQAEYARITGVLLPTVSQWVKRSKEGKGQKRIGYMDLEASLGLTLVERPEKE